MSMPHNTRKEDKMPTLKTYNIEEQKFGVVSPSGAVSDELLAD